MFSYNNIEIICLVLLSIQFASGFYANPFARFSRQLVMSWNDQTTASGLGLHGTNFKFMPVVQNRQDEYFPRMVQVAGVYPGVTRDDFFAPRSSETPTPNMWSYFFPDPDEPQIGIVAIAGGEVIERAIDPIVLVTNTEALGIRNSRGVEVLAVIDRGNVDVISKDFYAFSDEEGNVLIGSTDEPTLEVIGKLILVILPFQENQFEKRSGFLEEDE